MGHRVPPTGSAQRGELQAQVRFSVGVLDVAVPETATQRRGAGGAFVGLGYPLWTSAVAVGAQHGASGTLRQRGGAAHAVGRAGSCGQQQQLVEAL